MSVRHRPGRMDLGTATQQGRRLAARIGAAADRRPRLHMLHVGKTGGTALRSALEPYRESAAFRLELHEHGTTLRDVPRGEKIFFVVRDPVDRFVSAFNSRLREGQPHHYNPWTEREREAFTTFRRPQDLAAAISSPDAAERGCAWRAMTSIGQVRHPYWRWFGSRPELEDRIEDVLLVGWFPELDAAFARLRDALALPVEAQLPKDDVTAHRAPANLDRGLSEAARSNLLRWYAADYAFLELCTELDVFVCTARPSPTASFA